MKLHYSQTLLRRDTPPFSFYYLMKLHYSQTGISSLKVNEPVLLPYEITLLSNVLAGDMSKVIVLLPYEITLLSNIKEMQLTITIVLLPYEITLLSNRSVLLS